MKIVNCLRDESNVITVESKVAPLEYAAEYVKVHVDYATEKAVTVNTRAVSPTVYALVRSAGIVGVLHQVPT